MQNVHWFSQNSQTDFIGELCLILCSLFFLKWRNDDNGIPFCALSANIYPQCFLFWVRAWIELQRHRSNLGSLGGWRDGSRGSAMSSWPLCPSLSLPEAHLHSCCLLAARWLFHLQKPKLYLEWGRGLISDNGYLFISKGKTFLRGS